MSDRDPSVGRALNEAARLESTMRRRAQRARTDLAELVDNALREEVGWEEIARWTGWSVEDLQALLGAEASRVYNRRYNRDRWRAVKAGEVEPYHGTAEAVGLGCDCDKCEQWRVGQQSAAKVRRTVGLPSGDPRHGALEGSSRYGCSCNECRTAQSERAPKRRRMALPPEQLAKVRQADRDRKRRSRSKNNNEGEGI